MSFVVVHIPHAATLIPQSVRNQYILNDVELDLELLRMTDHFTDELFDVMDMRSTVCFSVSRLVVDPERFVNDDAEPMSARGMGAVYTRTSQGRPLRRTLTTDERDELIKKFYEPHHQLLEEKVNDALAIHGRCLIIDAHSFPSVALPYEIDGHGPRPPICLGTDPFHTPGWLIDHAVTVCQGAGFDVSINRPFAGALVPASHYQQDSRVASLMVEVRRDLYMDEATGYKSPEFNKMRNILCGFLKQILSGSQGC